MKKGLTALVLYKEAIILFCLFIFLHVPSVNAQNIIPKPQKVTSIPGEFTVNKSTSLMYYDNSLKETVEIIQANIKSRFGLDLKSYFTEKISNHTKNTIYLEIVSNMSEEAYTLKIERDRIICRASSGTGLFYGMQSFIQLMEQGRNKNKITIPCLFIDDKPEYSWRGYMLDESRHFFGKETVKQYLDIMASLKLNRFHWHLTDEPAWRIEIKKYPLLTEIGSTGSWDDRNAPKAFYTQEDVKEIVEYARLRNIMIIPEIDMPGHATAAARSYPEISGGGTGRWKGFTFHPAQETTYEFIDNVLTEIAELFPAPYIHIGADEVHYGNQSWFTDPDIQKFIKDNGLKDEIGLEHYFVQRACKIVRSKGKQMIGWDEITNAAISPQDAVVMWWRHDKPEMLTKALDQGFEVILTPRIPCYFDFVQDDSHKIGRRWGKDFNTIETVYNFPENIDSLIYKYPHKVVGLQANVWTERIKDKKRLDYMTFPRLLAIAEDGWTPLSLKNYPDFEQRVKTYMQYLKQLGLYFFDIFDKNSTPEPWGPDKADEIAEG